MKLLLSLIFIGLAPNECKNSQEKSMSAKQDYSEIIQISYEAFSRGYFNYIAFENTKMLITQDINRQSIDTTQISKQEWSDLLNLMNSIDLNTLENLKVPTDKRLYDGAAHCTMSVILKDKTYITPSFDEGFPPEQIKTLVNKMLSISKNHLKH